MLSTYIPMTKNQSDAIKAEVDKHIEQNGPPQTNLVRLWCWMRAYNNAVQNGQCVQPGVSKEYVQTFSNYFDRQADPACADGDKCTFCGARGHLQRECMSLIKMTREARKCGFGAIFGELKGLAYFRAEVNEMPKVQLFAYSQSKGKHSNGNGRKRARYH